MTQKLSPLATVRNRTYEIIAFITGFTLMVFELVASRILAPTIGSSTYVWTSVIGVIIAALSLGYAVGGKIADKRVARSDIAWLLLVCALTIAATLTFSEGILQLIAGTGMDARLKGLLASVLLFMPTSFVLGVISPYLVRLHTVSLAVAGQSVASLSALNAIGGIIGTFSAGFIFFSYFGSKETLALLVILLIGSSWLLRPRLYWRQRALAGMALIFIVATTLVPQASAITGIDTPTAHYEISDHAYESRTLRVLATGPSGWQSGVDLEDPTQLAFPYTQVMAGIVRLASDKSDILVIGGGAYTLPEFLANKHPNSHIDVVEIDPKLETIAKDYFSYSAPPNVRSIAADGRAFLNNNTKKYDLILVDVFSDTSIPFAVTTSEYVSKLRDTLAPNGAVIVNIIGSASPACAPLLSAINATYSRELPFHAAIPVQDPSLKIKQNIIAVYARQKPSWFLNLAGSTALPKGAILRDNFAPVERLNQQCK